MLPEELPQQKKPGISAHIRRQAAQITPDCHLPNNSEPQAKMSNATVIKHQ